MAAAAPVSLPLIASLEHRIISWSCDPWTRLPLSHHHPVLFSSFLQADNPSRLYVVLCTEVQSTECAFAHRRRSALKPAGEVPITFTPHSPLTDRLPLEEGAFIHFSHHHHCFPHHQAPTTKHQPPTTNQRISPSPLPTNTNPHFLYQIPPTLSLPEPTRYNPTPHYWPRIPPEPGTDLLTAGALSNPLGRTPRNSNRPASFPPCAPVSVFLPLRRCLSPSQIPQSCLHVVSRATSA